MSEHGKGVEYPVYMRGYFMSTDQELAVRGRMMTEYVELKQKITLLDAEAHKMGAALRNIGDKLSARPFALEPSQLQGWLNNIPERDRITALATEFHQAMKRKGELRREFKNLGLDLAD
jgi:hypothetical protein